MAIPIKRFYSTQTSAPRMSGTVGDMIPLLDAVLVTGFNSRNVSSIVVTANVALVTTTTDHNYQVEDAILFAGANESIFNDDFRITSVPATNQFTFNITTGNGTATGTIACKVAPLGWEKVFSGTNKAVYRSTDVTSTRLFLRVDDTNAQYSEVNIYETMSSVDVGTGASSAKYWKKSEVSSTSARPWNIIGNSKIFYFLVDWHTSYSKAVYFFGDFISKKQADGFRCMLHGHDTSTPATPATNMTFSQINNRTDQSGVIARSYTQIGSSVPFYKLMGLAGSRSNMGYDTTYSYPNPPDYGVNLFPVYIFEYNNNVFRGKMPGLYTPNEATQNSISTRNLSVKDENGKRYMCFIFTQSNNNYYCSCWFAFDEEWT